MMRVDMENPDDRLNMDLLDTSKRLHKSARKKFGEWWVGPVCANEDGMYFTIDRPNGETVVVNLNFIPYIACPECLDEMPEAGDISADERCCDKCAGIQDEE